MHKLTVTLKQHTPLIHFQHDQEGATLRASEVKPKLDRFIVERCFHNNFEECRQYLVGYNPDRPDALRDKFNDAERPYRALDYKMRINAAVQRIINIGAQYPSRNNSLLQLNIGKDPEEFVKMSFSENIEINFVSSSFDVKNLIIDDDLKFFFFYENFGNRTSKGFGSFTLETYNGVEVEYPTSEYHWNYAQFDILPINGNIVDSQAYKTIFAAVQKSWKVIKKFKNCRGNLTTNVLLNVNIDGECRRQYERVPSPIFFKPVIYEKNRQKWELDIILGLNECVIEHVYGRNAQNAKNQYAQIINDVINNYNEQVDFDDYSVELENNIIENITI